MAADVVSSVKIYKRQIKHNGDWRDAQWLRAHNSKSRFNVLFLQAPVHTGVRTLPSPVNPLPTKFLES